jgi:DNA-binding response OmpR family regulator
MTNAEPSAAAHELRGKVLCIEDDPVNMALVEAMLAQFPGVMLVKACNGTDGVRLARDERPDLVLLDMHLPDIGGLEVVRSLSELISERRLRVVLLTADSLSMDVVKAMSLGADDYWVKPLSKERLQAGLVKALRPAAGSGTPH